MNDVLYKEEILEHYRDPQNFGRLAEFDVSSKQLNPFCGDEIELFVNFKSNYSSSDAKQSREVHKKMSSRPFGLAQGGQARTILVVEEVGFTGVGCVISVASASMLTEYMLGKSKQELTKFSQNDMLSLLGIEVSETRKKCALLSLAVLKDCLK